MKKESLSYLPTYVTFYSIICIFKRFFVCVPAKWKVHVPMTTGTVFITVSVFLLLLALLQVESWLSLLRELPIVSLDTRQQGTCRKYFAIK